MRQLKKVSWYTVHRGKDREIRLLWDDCIEREWLPTTKLGEKGTANPWGQERRVWI